MDKKSHTPIQKHVYFRYFLKHTMNVFFDNTSKITLLIMIKSYHVFLFDFNKNIITTLTLNSQSKRKP
jgi:hypothetical protein